MKQSPFGFDEPEKSPGFLLWQVTMSWQREIKKALEVHNVSHSQFVILAILLWWKNQKKELTQNEIIQMSKMDKMTVSKSLKILTGKGLVDRCESKNDSRKKVVNLTVEGANLACQLVPLIESTDGRFFDLLSKNECSDLLKILYKLSR